MVDHNIEKIADFSNKVMVLHEGELVAYGETHEVFANKKLLNNHFVRVPQVTEAALEMKAQLELGEMVPIKLTEAEKVFGKVNREGK